MDTRIKWYKNTFRFAMVFVCSAIAWVGAADLDKFVAFIGCFAWCVASSDLIIAFRVSLLIWCLVDPNGQCAALLRVPSDAALQGMLAHAQGQAARYRTYRIRARSGCVYHRSEYRGSSLLPILISYLCNTSASDLALYFFFS